MNCFTHTDQASIGSCKSCGKGICSSCVSDTKYGLACKDNCELDVSENWEMNERGKKIYGIGKYKSKLPASGVLLWGLLAFLAWGVVGWAYSRIGHLNMDLVFPAVFFTVVLLFAWYSSKRTGINC